MSYRLSKDTMCRFTSMDELREAWQLKPLTTKKPNNEKRLKKVQEDFCSHHKCRACGKPMTWIGGDIMTCCNPQCRGIKVERTDEDGNKIINYITSYNLLSDHYAEIAETIFT